MPGFRALWASADCEMAVLYQLRLSIKCPNARPPQLHAPSPPAGSICPHRSPPSDPQVDRAGGYICFDTSFQLVFCFADARVGGSGEGGPVFPRVCSSNANNSGRLQQVVYRRIGEVRIFCLHRRINNALAHTRTMGDKFCHDRGETFVTEMPENAPCRPSRSQEESKDLIVWER